ncbi:hypothetical protein BC355_17600 [Vibrio cholerae]|uniref:TraG N-terminal Proteobacteria domain-containing protein n=1 Tax=Vibrio cholerae TaxID=666 RepID=A0A395TF42_VIBCL|nr:conjugal transfer protein TraG N-terminal domain-containing protein [Vibrio cholerae]RGP82974.1 hypothetical protein BC355_17600 [Vibrio cholerae]RGP83314.1 hypothetical protein BC353_17560 [Vibrio cholerae]
MQWNIVSFGDVTVLLTVFNAIASIAADGSYKAAAAIALFVFAGAMMLSLSDGKQEIPVHRVLVGFMLYTMGFTTLQTVTLENRYDGTVAVVDNIPVAIAVPASLISNVGLKLATLTETAFGNVNAQERISDTGYLSPMRVIAKYYSATQNSCPAGMVNSNVAGYRFCQSIYTFMNECVLPTAKRDGLTAVLKNQNIVSALDVKSKSFGTRLTKSDGSSEYPNCQEASEKVNLMLTSGDFEKMINSLGKQFQTRDGETAITQSQDVLAMIGVDAGNARSLMTTIMASKLIEDAELSFYHSVGGSHYAENILSSIEQRNYAWAVQGELWTQIVNKFITIMECLLYAMTPIIGLMVLCGALGKKTLLLYLQMLGAIQLIPMLLVVAQNIIMTQFAREMFAVQIQHEVGSIVYTQKMFEVAKELMGLGGMIAATIVPAMAMALITGSGMAMMGAMKGTAEPAKDTDAVGNHTDQGGAIHNVGNLNTASQDRHGNFITQSTMTNLGKLTKSASVQQQTQQAEQRVHTAEQGLTQALSNVSSDSLTRGLTASQVNEAGSNITQASTDSKDWSAQTTKQLMQSHGLTETQASNVLGHWAIGAYVSAKVGTPMQNLIGSGAELGGRTEIGYNQGFNKQLSKEEKDALSDITTGSHAESYRSSLEKGQSIIERDSTTNSTGVSELDSRIEKVDEARAEKLAASESYQKVKSATEQLSMTDDDLATNYYMKAHENGADARINSFIDKLNPEQQRYFAAALDEYDGGVNANNMDDKTAKLAATAATANAFNLQSEFIENVWGAQKPNDDNIPDELPMGNLEPVRKGIIPDQKPKQAHTEENLTYDHNNATSNANQIEYEKFEQAINGTGALHGVAYSLFRAVGDIGNYVTEGAEKGLNTVEDGLKSLPQATQNMYNHLDKSGYMATFGNAKDALIAFSQDTGSEMGNIVKEWGFAGNQVEDKLEQAKSQSNDKTEKDKNEKSETPRPESKSSTTMPYNMRF